MLFSFTVVEVLMLCVPCYMLTLASVLRTHDTKTIMPEDAVVLP